MVWKLADAKNKFSKLVDMALEVGPQQVTRRHETVVVIKLEELEHLRGKKTGFKQYLMQVPSLEGVNLQRDASKIRGIDL